VTIFPDKNGPPIYRAYGHRIQKKEFVLKLIFIHYEHSVVLCVLLSDMASHSLQYYHARQLLGWKLL